MRLVLIAIATLWGIGALFAFLRTRERSLDAKLTAGYLVAWPALLVLVYLNQPLPLWIGLPVMFGFIPWFLAGPHLWEILKDPSRTRRGELVGIPMAYWKWGSIAAVLLGLLFNTLVRP
jgi:hypothetical protein